jgi:hypothetical protein
VRSEGNKIEAIRARHNMNSPPAGGGVPAQAGGVVGARVAHVTTPSASHPPLLEKEGSKAGPVILLGALSLALAACCVFSLAGAPADAAAAEKAAAKPAAQKVERLACTLGTEDNHARIAVEVLNGRVNRFAYYSKWKPRTCSMEVARGDAYSRWADHGPITTVLLREEMGLFWIDYGHGRYHFTFSDIDRMRYCGMGGKINGHLTIRRANPKCELDGLMEENPVAE